MNVEPEPTPEQIDDLVGRIDSLAEAALIDHPQRERAVEILAAGGHLFARRDGDAHIDLYVGWLQDPEMRPADADPHETIRPLRAPRRVLLGGATGRGNS